jgi:CheY-like chemotaxis protein
VTADLHCKAKVLVIDDLADIHSLVTATLDDFCEVRCVDNGASGVTTARGWHPDVIICDMIMPGLSGFETIRRLRAEHATAEMPVLLVTGAADEVEEFPGLKEMVVKIVAKPFSVLGLRETVRGLLPARQLAT